MISGSRRIFSQGRQLLLYLACDGDPIFFYFEFALESHSVKKDEWIGRLYMDWRGNRWSSFSRV